MPGLTGYDEGNPWSFDKSDPANAGGRVTISRPINTAKLQEVPAQLF